MRGVARCLTTLLLSGVALQAQDFPACARPAIASREELAQVLRSLPSLPHSDLHAAAVAGQGQPVVGWALELAADSSGATPAQVRAAALLVLRYARWRPAIPTLVQLARPLRGEWVVWRGAMAALAGYPYPELEPWWLDLVGFPRRVVREQALRGLAISGTPQAMLIVREKTRKDTGMHPLVAEVEARLHLPMAARDTATFAWPPDSTGRFTPSEAFAARAARALCAR